jgi:hypothetical protein
MAWYVSFAPTHDISNVKVNKELPHGPYCWN